MQREAQVLIDAANASAAFEAVPDGGWRIVRHRNSGWRCVFQPNSDASIDIFENPRAAASEDVQCAESGHHWVNTYRISRFPGARMDDVFPGAATLGRRQFETVREELSTRQLFPDRATAEISPPLRELALIGEDMTMPVVVYVGMVQLPGDWFIMTRYHAYLPTRSRGEARRMGRESAQRAAAAFATTISEWTPPPAAP